ncbi:MAG: copper-translocating P-type ATPase [candidate division Zixibacteria bacterium]|nr:copper-translocating P-type ATPase [candidate division Zixibacteria bacterium]
MAADFRRRFWISLIITVPVLLLSPMIQQFLGIREAVRFSGDSYILLAAATIVFIYGGYPFLKGLFDELKSKSPGMMTLIGLAIMVSYGYSALVVFGLEGRLFLWELATLVDVMLLGHWIEMKSVMGASRALEELSKMMPDSARRITESGETEEVSVDELQSGDKILVKPGDKVPADGKIYEGESSVDESMVTGESQPVPKKSGDEVIGGSINSDGSIKIEVEKSGDESFLSQTIKIVKEAQESKSRSQGLADRAALWLTIIALTAGTITLIVWLTWAGRDFSFALTRSVTVMVITCPHALGLAIPLVVAVSTAIGAGSGLLIRNRTAFEFARKINAIIFDKTGTLTKGEFGVAATVIIDKDIKNNELLKIAASVEYESEHPIAKGIVEATGDRYEVKDFSSIPGKGAEGEVNKSNVKVVSPNYLRENKIDIPDSEKLQQEYDKGRTIVYVLIDDQLKGAIAMEDIIRDESKEAVSELKKMNIKPVMLTGDNDKVARWVAENIGIEDYFAEVLPKDKASKIKEVKQNGYKVAMVGDGVNDAPALAEADLGVAIGAGTDVAAETADVILVKSNPKDVISIIKLADKTHKKMLQNLGWATGYNAFAIPLAAGVLYSYGILLSPAMGAILMSLSTVIVAINAKFLSLE